MRLATIRTAGGMRAVRIDDNAAVALGHPDVGSLLHRPGWRAEAAEADGPQLPLDGLDYAPVVTSPEKIICVGLNYRSHIQEMGRELPGYPTLLRPRPDRRPRPDHAAGRLAAGRLGG